MSASNSNSPLLTRIFDDPTIVRQIQKQLPRLFWVAHRDATLGNRENPVVGFIRKQAMIYTLFRFLGRENVEILQALRREINVRVDGRPVVIRTHKVNPLAENRHAPGTTKSGIKALWSGDTVTSRETLLSPTYRPSSDIILIIVDFSAVLGAMYLITRELQETVLKELTPQVYFKLPRPGQDSRGAEFSRSAMRMLLNNPGTRRIEIRWTRPDGNDTLRNYDPYDRFGELWNNGR